MNMGEATKLVTAYKERKRAAVSGIKKRIYVYDVPVDHEEKTAVARVRANNDLDTEHEDGFYYLEPGRHKGITKLNDGRFVVIFFSEDGNLRDWGVVVSAKEAAKEIIESGNTYLFLDRRYKELHELIEYGSRRELLPAEIRKEVGKGIRERLKRGARRKK